MNMLLKLYSNFKNNIFKYYNTSFIISIMVSTLMDTLVNINRAKYLPSTWLAFLFFSKVVYTRKITTVKFKSDKAYLSI